MHKLLPLAVASPLVVLLDQWSKVWAVDTLRGKPAIEVVADYFHFVYAQNNGAAFGILQRLPDGLRVPFFVVVSLLAIGFVLTLYWKSADTQKLLAWALALVLGGAIGNFIDRVRLSYVVDFIDWHYKDVYHWPTFNIADAAITCGVVMLVIDMLRGPHTSEVPAEAAGPADGAGSSAAPTDGAPTPRG